MVTLGYLRSKEGVSTSDGGISVELDRIFQTSVLVCCLFNILYPNCMTVLFILVLHFSNGHLHHFKYCIKRIQFYNNNPIDFPIISYGNSVMQITKLSVHSNKSSNFNRTC